jgi:hypothetical protein
MSPWHCAPGAVLEPATSWTHAVPGPVAPSSSLSLRCHRPHDALELATSPNPRYPWARNAVILPKPARLQYCIFFFVILGLQIMILICYIATLLWYATLLLFCCIALMYYITTLLWYTTLPLTCRIALICYIATLLWYATLPHCFDMLYCFWYAALLWYATLPHCFDMLYCFCSTAFLWYATLSHCFDMLHIATLLLFFYILIYMNAYYITQWWKWAKWDECGNMDQLEMCLPLSFFDMMEHYMIHIADQIFVLGPM